MLLYVLPPIVASEGYDVTIWASSKIIGVVVRNKF